MVAKVFRNACSLQTFIPVKRIVNQGETVDGSTHNGQERHHTFDAFNDHLDKSSLGLRDSEGEHSFQHDEQDHDPCNMFENVRHQQGQDD